MLRSFSRWSCWLQILCNDWDDEANWNMNLEMCNRNWPSSHDRFHHVHLPWPGTHHAFFNLHQNLDQMVMLVVLSSLLAQDTPWISNDWGYISRYRTSQEMPWSLKYRACMSNLPRWWWRSSSCLSLMRIYFEMWNSRKLIPIDGIAWAEQRPLSVHIHFLQRMHWLVRHGADMEQEQPRCMMRTFLLKVMLRMCWRSLALRAHWGELCWNPLTAPSLGSIPEVLIIPAHQGHGCWKLAEY